MRPVERCTLHIALPYRDLDRPATLHVGTRRHPLTRHTPDSLAAARADNSAVRLLPEGVLTHYVADVELPADAPQLLLITEPARDPDGRLPAILLTKLHVPRVARAAEVKRRRAVGRLGPDPVILAAGGTDDGTDPEAPVDVDNLVTAMDAAIQCVSQHLELFSNSSATAATVTSIIKSTGTAISDLRNIINQQQQRYQQGQSTVNWVNESQYVLPDGSPSGTASYAWSPTTLEWMTAPVQAALQTSKNDTSLESTSESAGLYTVQSGVTTVASTQGSSPAALRGAHVVPADAEQDDDAGPTWTVNDLTPGNGFSYNNDLTLTDNVLSASFTNSWLRWLGGYVEFLDAGGDVVTPSGWTSQVPGGVPYIDSDTQKYVAMYSSVDTILAIPVDASPTQVEFQWPANASGVRIWAGGLGRSGGVAGQSGVYYGSWDTQICTVGLVMTSIFNFAIPTIMLSVGAAISESELTDLAKSCAGPALDIASAVINGPLAAQLSGGDTDTILTACADAIPHLLLDSPDLVAALVAAFTEDAVEESIPVFGWIAMAVNVATTVAELAQTTAEVASSPAAFEIVATAAMDATWMLLPDPAHGMWPLEATSFTVTATYAGGTTRQTTGVAPPQNTDAPLVVSFDAAAGNQLPAGGTVTFTATFYSDTGWICAAAASAPITLSIDEPSIVVPEQAITENLIPLASTTQYEWQNTLTWDATAGAREWAKTDRSTATINDLDPTDDVAAIGALGQISVNQTTNQLAYDWQASFLGLPVDGAATNAQTYVFQTVGITDTAGDVGTVDAGFVAGAPVGLGLQEPANGANFYVDPTDEEYHVRQLALAPTSGTIPFPQDESFGRFNEQIDAFVLHPAGYAVGINTEYRKLEVLALPAAATTDAAAPLAEMYAGYGSRAGLLHEPVGVAPAVGAGVIVLENADESLGAAPRLQAFDLRGNPAPIFAGGQSTVPLQAETTTVTGLALATESQGYIYVLKYVGDGTAVADYLLDLYAPDGTFVSQTVGLPAGSIAVDLWRTLYTLDYQTMAKPAGSGPEPTVSEWTPSPPPPAPS